MKVWVEQLASKLVVSGDFAASSQSGELANLDYARDTTVGWGIG